MGRRAATAVGWVLAAVWVLNGAWAFVAPRSFYDAVATFPPYNIHFVHDIGAFSIGLGAVLLLAMRRWSAPRAALIGVGIGSVVHLASHVVDYDIKPSVTDLVGLAVWAAVTLAAGLAIED
jgi:hypothetical protein